MKRTLIKDLESKKEQTVFVSGWIDIRRDQGKLIFLDISDRTGQVQAVILPNNIEAMGAGKEIRPEWVVEIEGLVNQRPEKNINDKVINGSLELEVKKIIILNKSETPPFDLLGDGKNINEEARLKYRFLDLKRERMQKNIRMRHKISSFIRGFLEKEDFVEIETPQLTKSTPEGARDYIVPSRLHPGKFYALPQSPQQYKQLLMTSRFERYFQFARCMRDEDTRGDRQPEFTQLDIEMSFVEQEDVMTINEKLLIAIVENLYPEKKIQTIPFPRIPFKDAMEKYGTDRPDLREDKNDPNSLAFCWITDFPFFEKDKNGKWTFTHNPFSAPIPEHMDSLLERRNFEKIVAAQYDIVLNGYEVGGGGIRNHNPEALKAVFEILGHSKKDVENNFGHMLTALSLGTPPHGGVAWGFDRLVMILQNEPNIREVIAFPKTGEGQDLMMDSPTEVSVEQLEDLGIKIVNKKDR